MIKNPNRLKFIHLTDCHITGSHGRERDSRETDSSVRATLPVDHLRAAIDSINTDHADADFVVITGNLTHCGEDEAYCSLARELRRLSIPAHLLVGNRDDARAFSFRFPDSQRCEHGFIQGSKRTPFGLCLFLDTSEANTSRGRYCERRRAWLKQALNETDGPVMLFMHHAPFHSGLGDADDCSLADGDQFWDILKPHRSRIRHLFMGHAEGPLFGNWHGISASGMRGLHPRESSRASAMKGEHGASTTPAYGIVLADGETIMVHVHDVTASSIR